MSDSIESTLGPLVLGVCHLLLRRAVDHGFRQIFFIARDGYLLHHASALLLAARGLEKEITLSYLHLSRRVTQLPARGRIEIAGVRSLLTIRAGRPTLARVLDHYGIPAEKYCPVFAKRGLSPATRVQSAEACVTLFGEDDFEAMISTECARQRRALLAYLAQAGFPAAERSVLMDIGWRGSIQNNLANIFSAEPSTRALEGLYVGLWREDGVAASLPSKAEGLVSDMRRGRNLKESAAWQASLLLEAVFRANEGTTTGYRYTPEQVLPILASDDAPARQAEIAGSRRTSSLQEGILEYVARHARAPEWLTGEEATLRGELQTRLLRLAFFPDADEIDLGKALVHTESHDPIWSQTLIHPVCPSPHLAPRQWVAGLASPWRAGYVMASGGKPLACVYRAAEAVLIALPAAIRNGLRRSALAFAAPPSP